MDGRGPFRAGHQIRPQPGQRQIRPQPGQQPYGRYISPYQHQQPPQNPASQHHSYAHQYVSPFHQTYQQSQQQQQQQQQQQFPFNNADAFQQLHVPTTGGGYDQTQDPLASASYLEPLDNDYLASGPVVHEGFVPAPGHEDDDNLDDVYPIGHRDFLFQSDDEVDSEDEEALLAEEERILRDIESRQDDNEIDSDYSMEDVEDYDDPDEILIDGEYDDEEEPQTRRRRSNAKGSRGRWKGASEIVKPPGIPLKSPGRPPKASGRSRGGSRGRGRKTGERRGPSGKRGPRPVADPGPKFKECQRIANDAFLRKDFPTAIVYANKAVQQNPEIFAAHSLLSEIYGDMGNEQMALQALIIGAPTKRDKELWFYIIDRIKQIDPDEYPAWSNATKTAVILDSLRAILQLDVNDYDARSQKLEIEYKLGNISRSIKLCRKMLTLRPSDDEILKMMARMGTSSAKMERIHLQRIIASFDTSIAYFLAHDEPSTSKLDWSLLNIYLDLLDRHEEYDRGLSRLKSIARWIQGRKDETYWNDQPDDCEFDIEDTPRRVTVLEFARRSHETRYGNTLPTEIRVKMGLFRVHQTPPNLEEAMLQFNMLEPHDDTSNGRVNDYPDLFRDVADELHTAGFNNEAVRFYETLYKCAFNYMGLRNLMGMYSAYVTINQPEKARDLLPVFREWEPETVQEMATLAKFFEDYDMEDEAMKWGEAVYKQGGARVLQKIGFQGYGELQEFFYQEKKRARGKYGVRKARIKKYTKHLRTATQNEDESEDDETGERPSLGPLTERPKAGLFRTRKTLGERPQTFLPDEIPGTNVPMGAIDHIVFKRKLNAIAEDYPEELKAARAQHREIVASFRRLQDLMQPAEEGKEPSLLEWMSIARELIEEFSTFDLFYYDRRKPFVGYFRRVGGRNELWNESALMVLAVAANNVEDGKNEPDIKEKPEKVPEDFYGIHFDRWVDVFAQYAVFLARQGEEERCFSTLEVAHQSNVVHLSQRHSHTLQLCRLACALALEDSPQGSVSLRWFMRTYPLNSDSFRLYSAISRLCSIPNGFATGPALKAFLRYIKTVDYTLLRADQRDGFNFRGEDFVNWIPKAVLEGVVKHVKDHDPALFALHGHVLMCGGSYMAALNYYFRAFAITPQDPVLNLSIGVAYIQHATKRLSENRQFQIQQGLAFVYRYHEIRTKDKIAGYCSEAEFNLGRIWHALGLVSQAIPAYERCISLSKRLREEPKQNGSCNDSNIDDFATEAAFAIQTIYALSGNFNGAWKVTKEALVIE